MYNILLTVVSPVGKFEGYGALEIDSYEKATRVRDELQQVLRSCDLFTMFALDSKDREITLSSGIVKNSVFIFDFEFTNK